MCVLIERLIPQVRHQWFGLWFLCEHANNNHMKHQTTAAVKLPLLLWARRWIHEAEALALDLFCYQPVTGGRRDPAAWPRRAEGPSRRGALYLSDPVPVCNGVGGGGGGCCCWAGFTERVESCVGVGVEGVGCLGRADKGGPQQDGTDPSFTLSMCPLPRRQCGGH